MRNVSCNLDKKSTLPLKKVVEVLLALCWKGENRHQGDAGGV
ncbi:hypothetical protein [Paenibacillus sp. 8b26]